MHSDREISLVLREQISNRPAETHFMFCSVRTASYVYQVADFYAMIHAIGFTH